MRQFGDYKNIVRWLTIAMLFASLLFCESCSWQPRLVILTSEEALIRVEEGESFTAPYRGWLISENYLAEILEALDAKKREGME